MIAERRVQIAAQPRTKPGFGATLGKLARAYVGCLALIAMTGCMQNPFNPGPPPPPPPPPGLLSVVPANLPNGAVGLAYDQLVSTSGGKGPFTWMLTSSAGSVPAGCSVMADPANSAQLEISGTPTIAGTYIFTVQVTDTETPPQVASGSFSITINSAPNPVPSITTLIPPSVPAGSAALPLTIVGSNFVSGATVNFGGTTGITATLGANPTQLMVTIPAANLTVQATFAVSVTNPAPGGGTSNALNFTVTSGVRTGLITLVSENYKGTGGGAADSDGVTAVSLTGRYVVFSSLAPDLIPPPGPTQSQELYLRDTCIGVTGICTPFTQLVAVNNNGQESNGSDGPNVSISEDGSVITFDSTATNLDPRVTTFGEWVYTRQLCGVGVGGCPSSTALESLDNNNLPTTGIFSTMSREGEFMAFSSNNNLVWLHDSCIGQNACLPGSVSVALGNGGIVPNSGSNPEAISVGGRFVYFLSNATNLGVTSGAGELYLRDVQKSTTSVVSVDNAGNASTTDSYSASISDDGRYMAFVTNSALVPNDLNGTQDVYIRDTCAGLSSCTPSTILVTVGTTGNAVSLGGFSGSFSMSSSGRYVAFISPSSDVVNGVTNQIGQNLAYVRDTCLGAGGTCTPTTHFVSMDSSGNQLGASQVTISGDGHYFAFVFLDPMSSNYQVAIGGTGY